MSLTWALFAELPPTIANPDRQLQGMGSPFEVRERIGAGLGNAVVWCKDGWGQYGDDGCFLDIHVPDNEDPIVCVFIQVRGLGAAETLLRLADLNGWCLVDDSVTPMVAS